MQFNPPPNPRNPPAPAPPPRPIHRKLITVYYHSVMMSYLTLVKIMLQQYTAHPEPSAASFCRVSGKTCDAKHLKQHMHQRPV